MSTHKTFFGKIFGSAWDWVKSQFDNADHDLLQTAFDITNAVKNALDSGNVDLIASLTPTRLDDVLIAVTREQLPKILAGELLLKDITPTSTEDEVKQTLSKVADIFGGLNDDDRQEFFTSVFANLYKLWVQVKSGEKITFGQAAIFAETTWQAYQQSKK